LLRLGTAVLAFVALLGSGLVLPERSEAQRRFGAGELVGACGGDYRRLCPGVPPGGGRILACLNQQAENLSQPCFQALAERGLAAAAAFRLCRPDFERLCPGLAPGMGRGLACLVEQSARLSPGCFDALDAHGLMFEGDVPPNPPRR
jgi:hypothetical protein